MIAALFPQAKIVCCVRDLGWVFDSLERLIRQNCWELSKIFDFDPAGTVYSRVDGLASRNGLVGFAYNALKQAMHSAESERLMLLTYETLTREPGYAMQAVYEFTGLPQFAHVFRMCILMPLNSMHVSARPVSTLCAQPCSLPSGSRSCRQTCVGASKTRAFGAIRPSTSAACASCDAVGESGHPRADCHQLAHSAAGLSNDFRRRGSCYPRIIRSPYPSGL
jgi:hypothetical protein